MGFLRISFEEYKYVHIYKRIDDRRPLRIRDHHTELSQERQIRRSLINEAQELSHSLMRCESKKIMG